MAGDVFLQLKNTLGIFALKQTVGLRMGLTTTLGAFRLEIGEHSRHQNVDIVLRLLDDTVGHLFDLVHELVTSKFALLHRLELVLPFARHLWRAQFLDPDRVQQIGQR